MILPLKFINARASMSADQIGFGVGGIRLFPIEELEKSQVGYGGWASL